MSKELKFLMIVVSIAIFLISSVVYLTYFSEDVEIVMKQEIYGAVEVKSVEDMFNNIEGELLEGDYSILCDSKEQFLDLVPRDKTIYMTFEIEEEELKFSKVKQKHYILNRTYLAFVNGIGVIVYKDLYEYRNGDRRYWIEGWSWWGSNSGIISFHYDNKKQIMFWIIPVIGIIALMVCRYVLTYMAN